MNMSQGYKWLGIVLLAMAYFTGTGMLFPLRGVIGGNK